MSIPSDILQHHIPGTFDHQPSPFIRRRTFRSQPRVPTGNEVDASNHNLPTHTDQERADIIKNTLLNTYAKQFDNGKKVVASDLNVFDMPPCARQPLQTANNITISDAGGTCAMHTEGIPGSQSGLYLVSDGYFEDLGVLGITRRNVSDMTNTNSILTVTSECGGSNPITYPPGKVFR